MGGGKPSLIIEVWMKDRYVMMGKVFHVRGEGYIFYHEPNRFLKAQDGSVQGSLGGVDRRVLEWCARNDVESVHHYDAKREALYVVGVKTLLATGDERFFYKQRRMYLPVERWTKQERKYKVPWVTSESVRRFGSRAEQEGLAGKGWEQEELFAPQAGPDKRFKPAPPPRTSTCIECLKEHKRRDAWGQFAPTCEKCALKATMGRWGVRA